MKQDAGTSVLLGNKELKYVDCIRCNHTGYLRVFPSEILKECMNQWGVSDPTITPYEPVQHLIEFLEDREKENDELFKEKKDL